VGLAGAGCGEGVLGEGGVDVGGGVLIKLAVVVPYLKPVTKKIYFMVIIC
jgi:hypothetical protein